MLMVILMIAGATGASRADPSAENSAARTLKTFDFDEERLGNFDRTPMNWQPLAAEGFPTFLRPRLDFAIGRTAPPAMYLPVSGGSVAARYTGRDIPADPAGDYRVTAWIRPNRLTHAVACISVCFVDRSLQPIDGTEQFSEALRSGAPADDWRPVAVELSGGYAGACGIRVTAWVAQPAARGESAPGPRPIAAEDAIGGAWFDDITVERLPRLTFEGAPQDVVVGDRDSEIDVRIEDVRLSDVTARLDLLDASGETVMTTTSGVLSGRKARLTLPIGRLAPGWYRAKAEAATLDGSVVRHERVAIRAADDLPAVPTRGGFVAVHSDGLPSADEAAAIERLVEWAGIGGIVLSMEGPRARSDSEPRLSREAGAALRRLGASGRVFLGEIGPSATDAAMADTMARLGSLATAWTFDAERESILGDPRGLVARFDRFRTDVFRLAGPSRLCIAWPVGVVPTELNGIDLWCATIPPGLPTARIADQVASFALAAGRPIWAKLDPGPHDQRDDVPLLAKRIIAARQGGAERVLLPAVWHRSGGRGASAITPTPAVLMLRTLAAVIGDRPPLGRVDLGDGIESCLFGKPGGDGVLVAWALDTSDGGWPLALEATAQCFDLSGRTAPAAGAGGIVLGDAPVLIAPVDPARLLFRDAVSLDGPPLEPGVAPAARQLRIVNRTGSRLSGDLRLTAPAGWDVAPASLALSVDTGNAQLASITIRVPRQAEAGSHPIGVELRPADGAARRLLSVARVEVGLAGLDVRTMHHVDDGRLSIEQRITNRLDHPIDLEATVCSPLHPRQRRFIGRLDPGRTVVPTFTIPDAASLRGRTLRLTLSRLGESTAANYFIAIDPDDAPATNGNDGGGTALTAASRR